MDDIVRPPADKRPLTVPASGLSIVPVPSGKDRPVRASIAALPSTGRWPLSQAMGCPEVRATAEECMSEAAFCLDQADRADGARVKALCLGVAALWHELAVKIARWDAQGSA